MSVPLFAWCLGASALGFALMGFDKDRPEEAGGGCRKSSFFLWLHWAEQQERFWGCTPFITRPGTGILSGDCPPLRLFSWGLCGFGGSMGQSFYRHGGAGR